MINIKYIYLHLKYIKKLQKKVNNHFSENNFNNISVKIFISSMKKGKYNMFLIIHYHVRNREFNFIIQIFLILYQV